MFSLIFQGSRPAGKDQAPKVDESFPVRVEENKIPVQHRGFGKPRWEESGKLAAGSNYETFTRYLETFALPNWNSVYFDANCTDLLYKTPAGKSLRKKP